MAAILPCEFTSPNDLQDARMVAQTFDVSSIEIDLTKTYNELKNAIEEKSRILTEEAQINIKPRLRMTTLYSIAQALDYLVIGTGNLCERMLGYTTKWGDAASDFNPIANFTVDEVIEIGRYLDVPEQILIKAPNDGLSGLTDEEKMGVTYKQITDMINTGDTDDAVKDIIVKKYNNSKHKREEIPIYKFERNNYLEKHME